MSNAELILAVSSFIAAMTFQTFGIIKYLLGVSNNGDKELHERINGVKDEYVKRSELDRDLNAINKTLALMREDFRDGVAQIQNIQKEQALEINKRFDLMAGNLIRAVKDKSD